MVCLCDENRLLEKVLFVKYLRLKTKSERMYIMYTTPMVIERTTHGVKEISLDSVLLERRIIFLDKPIDTESVNEVIKQLLVLSSLSDKPIIILINSPGGNINDGLGLIDVFEAIPNEIWTVSTGMAASMGGVILAAGNKRFITEHSRVMLHEPLIQNGSGGSCSSVSATAKALQERKDLINKLLCKYTGKSRKVINKATSFDNYMNAKEAKELNIVDEILSQQKLYEILKGVC